MNLSLFIFLICFFKMTICSQLNHEDYFIIRQVGQGLWTTRVLNDSCEHFDFGGEIFQARKLKQQFISQCFNKLNILHLSHAHMDHYAFLGLIAQNSKSICWGSRPPEYLKNNQTQIPFCKKLGDGQIIYFNDEPLNKNDRSIIMQMNEFLMPGDSSSKIEKIWSLKLKDDHFEIKYLVLGHHGSRTATSELLIHHLPNLKMAFASARFQVYRHPDAVVIKRLRDHLVPVIKTEDWGDIKINRF